MDHLGRRRSCRRLASGTEQRLDVIGNFNHTLPLPTWKLVRLELRDDFRQRDLNRGRIQFASSRQKSCRSRCLELRVRDADRPGSELGQDNGEWNLERDTAARLLGHQTLECVGKFGDDRCQRDGNAFAGWKSRPP